MALNAVDLQALVEEVCELAVAAGETILNIYSRDFSVVQKSDLSPLTEADMASHHILQKGFDQLTPTIPVLSEEGGSFSFRERQAWDQLWLIDPLDGTREFIKRNGEFTVNISLVAGSKAVLGVIYAPVTSECYFAYTGGGAYKRDAAGKIVQIHTRQWDGGHIVVAGSRSQRTQNFERFLAGFSSYETITLGSALKSCVVAEGRADIYARFGPTCEWDTAAAQIIVEEAGGRMMALDGSDLTYNRRESLLNPSFMVVGDGRHLWKGYLPDCVLT